MSMLLDKMDWGWEGVSAGGVRVLAEQARSGKRLRKRGGPAKMPLSFSHLLGLSSVPRGRRNGFREGGGRETRHGLQCGSRRVATRRRDDKAGKNENGEDLASSSRLVAWTTAISSGLRVS